MACVEHTVFFLTRKSTYPKHIELSYLHAPTEYFKLTGLDPAHQVRATNDKGLQIFPFGNGVKLSRS